MVAHTHAWWHFSASTVCWFYGSYNPDDGHLLSSMCLKPMRAAHTVTFELLQVTGNNFLISQHSTIIQNALLRHTKLPLRLWRKG
jgi:hypothetical protein